LPVLLARDNCDECHWQLHQNDKVLFPWQFPQNSFASNDNSMNLQLENKLSLVTGSTAGIGFAIATALAAEGARVIVNGRTAKRVSEAIEKIRATHREAKLESLPVDLSTASGVNEAVRLFPEVEILVNNLGIFEPKPFEKIPDEDWMRFFEVNVMSGVRLSRAYLPK
jgi:NAD(P)-dependent dehydrogenase (short-subunit alcohol dehydrogenase family)